MGAVACLADARPLDEYAATFQAAGFDDLATEDARGALLDMIRQIDARLLVAQIGVGLKKLDLCDVDLRRPSASSTKSPDACLTASAPTRSCGAPLSPSRPRLGRARLCVVPLEDLQELARRHDSRTFILAQDQEIFVLGDEVVGLCRPRRREELVVVGVAGKRGCMEDRYHLRPAEDSQHLGEVHARAGSKPPHDVGTNQNLDDLGNQGLGDDEPISNGAPEDEPSPEAAWIDEVTSA